MLFEIVFQSLLIVTEDAPGCDLMLFEIVFQYRAEENANRVGCDLMLFEIVFQWRIVGWRRGDVVI